MQQISEKVFCDDFIAGLKLERRLMPNPYNEYPYLIIKGFLSPSFCRRIADYTRGVSEAERARLKSGADAYVDETVRKTAIHTLPEVLLREYGRSFTAHQRQMEHFFRIAMTTATEPQVLEYTRGSFYMRHADDSSEIVDGRGETVGFVRVAPQRRITTVLFATSYQEDGGGPYRFSGGELLFNYLCDAEGNPVRFCPEAGDMIIFPSNPLYSHEVLPVREGYRLTLVQWHNGIVA